MLNSRRKFLVAAAVALGTFCLCPASLSAQDPNWSPVTRPPVVEGKNPLEPDAATKAALAEQNRKAIKKDVESLYELAAQLKAEVERTDSTTVLSLALVKKAEKIEKLAKHIKGSYKELP